MPKHGKKLRTIEERLEGIEGTLDDFNKLLTNHATHQTAELDKVKTEVAHLAKTTDLRFKGVDAKLDTYKWTLVAFLAITVIMVGGFVTLAVFALQRLVGS